MRHTLSVSLTLLVGCSSVDVGLTDETTNVTTAPSTGAALTTSGEPATTGAGESEPTGGDPSSPSTSGGTTNGPTSLTEVSATDGVSTGSTGSGGAEESTLAPDTGSTAGDGSNTESSTGSGMGEDGDGDGVPDGDDNCVEQANEDQLDSDGDGVGDLCDDDDDDDTIPDDQDNCPLTPNPMQQDADADMIGDVCDDDKDNDTIPDADDNCPTTPNQDQKDLDTDGQGDVCDPDKDNDTIPDEADVFPEDGGQPGVVIPKKMYAHSSSALSTVDVVDYAVVNIGAFKWPQDGGSHQMTDLAIDRYGVLYGVTFDRLYVCNPTSVQCFNLGTLPGSFNGLTWIPAGTLDPDKDSLIAITSSGTWNHLTIQGGVVSSKQLGTYGAGYTSAGDAFSIEGVGTYAAVTKQGVGSTVIASVDPLTGKVLSELATTTGFSSVFGLAGWEGLIIAFDSSSTMIKIDPGTKVVTNLGKKNVAWWGAGVGTLLPQ